jgi:protein TonB
MRLQAQIDKRVEEYQKRPRKRFIGARATEYRFALYEEGWRAKIERVGTLNYPAEARGKIYGSLRLTGDAATGRHDRPRGARPQLRPQDTRRGCVPDSADGGTVCRFPADIIKDTDLLVITRTWFFAQGDKIWT